MTSDLLEVQGDGVLCIIIDKKGSTPRTVGSMMFINEKGIIGSIGGGREEYQAILDAKNCHEVMMKHYELNNSESANLGMISYKAALAAFFMSINLFFCIILMKK